MSSHSIDHTCSWGTARVPSVLSVHSLTEEENESVATICEEDIDVKEMESSMKQLSPQSHPTPPLPLQSLQVCAVSLMLYITFTRSRSG